MGIDNVFRKPIDAGLIPSVVALAADDRGVRQRHRGDANRVLDAQLIGSYVALLSEADHFNSTGNDSRHQPQ
jgi:hypothetical protein